MMYWESWHAFMHMGGYAAYVWGSFGAAVLMILLEVVLLRRRAAALMQMEDQP